MDVTPWRSHGQLQHEMKDSWDNNDNNDNNNNDNNNNNTTAHPVSVPWLMHSTTTIKEEQPTAQRTLDNKEKDHCQRLKNKGA
jgi:hypothetical protein